MIPRELKMLIDFTMGDGYIGMSQGRKNARMRIEHAEKQRAYAEHKELLLRSIDLPVRAKLITVISGKNIGKSYYRVDINQHSLLTTAYKWTYNKGRKSIDKALLRQLDAESLAYWFMDDGSAKLVKYLQKSNYRYYYDTPKIGAFKFSNQSFTLEENQLFVDWMKEKFDINARITNNNGLEVYISSIPEKQKFLNTIKPYIIPEMYYKIQYPLDFKDIGYTIVQLNRLSEKGVDSTYATVETYPLGD